MALPLRFEGKDRGWATVLAVAGVLLWLALAALGGDFLHAAYLKYSSLASPAYAMFLARRGWLWCHLAGGSLGVVLGLAQLITQRWPRAWGVHRWCGRAYFAAMSVAVFGAAGLIATSPAPMSIRVAFSATMLAWLLTAGVGLVKILRRDVQAHRRWMLRAYVVTLAPAVFRLGLATAVGQGIAPSPGLIAWMLWGSWALPLLVYGVGERARSGHLRRAGARTATVRAGRVLADGRGES